MSVNWQVAARAIKRHGEHRISMPGNRHKRAGVAGRRQSARLDVHARRKYVIPFFSGHRAPERVGRRASSLGLDISSLLVLGWLGLVRKVFGTFEKNASATSSKEIRSATCGRPQTGVGIEIPSGVNLQLEKT
jgi:hypothetical protein